jgi:hypothetical protein
MCTRPLDFQRVRPGCAFVLGVVFFLDAPKRAAAGSQNSAHTTTKYDLTREKVRGRAARLTTPSGPSRASHNNNDEAGHRRAMKPRSQTAQERAIMVGTTTTTTKAAATVVGFVFAAATVLGGGGLRAARGSSTHGSTHTGLVASSYYAAAAAAAASASHLQDWFGAANRQRKEDCFAPDGPFAATTTTADSSFRVLRQRPKPDDDHETSGSPPLLRKRRRRPDGRYRDKFTLRVSLEMPTLRVAHDDAEAAAFHEDGGGSEAGRQRRTVESELVIVTESTVASRDGQGQGFYRRLEEEVDVTYHEVSSRSTSVSSSSSSDHDKAPAWVEICHAKTTTVRSVSSGIRPVGRLRRRLSLSPTSQVSAATVNRCAPLLLATTTTTTDPSPSGDEFGSSTVGDTAPDGPTITRRTAGIAAASATTTTSRYLGVVPDFPVRIGDTWHVLLPWQGHDGDHHYPPPQYSGGGPSLTGVATLLGYRSSSCGKENNDAEPPPNVAVIQVRGTKGAIDWTRQLWGNVVGSGSGDVPSIAAAATTSKTTTTATTSVVVGDVDVLAIVHFDVASQLVRRVEADQAFVLHVSGDVGVDPSSPFQVNSVAIPVRGRAVLETTQL